MQLGKLAQEICGVELPLKVLESAAGFYIGTADEKSPVSRESVEYWRKQEAADLALRHNLWTQRKHP